MSWLRHPHTYIASHRRTTTRARQLTARHADWAYAVNIHPAQGKTADTVHYLATPTMYRELALVAGSRHRYTITWHVTAGSNLQHLRGPEHPLTLTDAVGWMSRSHEELAAPAPPRRADPELTNPDIVSGRADRSH